MSRITTDTKITTLTVAQKLLLSEVRDKWLRIGLSTGPGDRPAAEAGVRDAYRAAGLQPPRFMIWLDSPWAGVIGHTITPGIVAEALRRSSANQVDAEVRVEVGNQVDAEIYAEVYAEVRSQVGNLVDAEVYAEVRSQVGNLVGNLVDAEVYAEVDDVTTCAWWKGRMWGCYNAGYYAWTDAMECIGVKGITAILGKQRVAKEIGFWWCFRDFAILTPRSDVLKRDEQGQLHCEDGPAMLWPDGFGIWAWHGTRVSREVIESDPETWSLKTIMSESNTEVRRVRIERLGWDRFVQVADLRLIDRQPDPANAPFTIDLYDVPEQIYEEPIRVAIVTNASPERDGTRRRFGITVPAQIGDAVEAIAWTVNETKDGYLQLERAC